MTVKRMCSSLFVLFGLQLSIPPIATLTLRELAVDWSLFLIKFNKTYSTSEEENLRFQIFTDNLRRISHHNEAAMRGKYSFTLGLNQFADMTDKEFLQDVLNPAMYSQHYQYETVDTGTSQPPNLTYIPKQIDWRGKKCITPVKDQDGCQSCYAFAATGAVESHTCLKTGKLVSLSEQNIIDCTSNNVYHNSGCKGGHVENSFIYIVENKGIDTEEAYPYTDKLGTCKYNKETSGAAVKNYEELPKGVEEQLQYVVGNIGPVAVAVDASSFGWKQYSQSGGVLDIPECNSTNLNHAVLVVGFGTEKGKDYWLIKNSWGKTWGIDGYVKLVRNKNNQCGIATSASYPII